MRQIVGNTNRSRTGVTMVEFALTFVIFAVLMFGVIEYGYLHFRIDAITHAVREAGRKGIVGASEYQGVNYCGQKGNMLKKIVEVESMGIATIPDVEVGFISAGSPPDAVPTPSADFPPRSTLSIRVNKDLLFITPVGPLIQLMTRQPGTGVTKYRADIQTRFITERFGGCE